MYGSVVPIRKLNFLSVSTSARNSAIASRNSRLRSGVVVLVRTHPPHVSICSPSRRDRDWALTLSFASDNWWPV